MIAPCKKLTAALVALGIALCLNGVLCAMPTASDLPPADSLQVSHNRLAAWRHSVAVMNEDRPVAHFMSYSYDLPRAVHKYGLLKIVPGIEAGGTRTWVSHARDTRFEEEPGRVRARFGLGQAGMVTTFEPAILEDRGAEWVGSALYRVEASGTGDVLVRIGGEALVNLHPQIAEPMDGDAITGDGGVAEITGDSTARFTSSLHALTTAVRTSGRIESAPTAGGGTHAVVRFPPGGGWIAMAFSTDPADAEALAATTGPETTPAELDRFYEHLLGKAVMETPNKEMDEAFRQAMVVMEYNYLEPYGWNESVHHWMALWHMQHTPAAQWIGQVDRARDCIMVHARTLMPDGSVPQFTAGGHSRKDFGGSNQFYLWQVRHFWKFTADREAIEELAAPLDRVLAQTWYQYDPDRDGLLAWGHQIGNQEDFVATPYNGTASTIEGIEMLRTRAMIARALGDTDTATRYERRALEITAKLRGELWIPDLARFAYFQDPHGYTRLDGQYQAFIYPVLRDIIAPAEAWPGMRHLRDRLTGPAGEVFVTNHFGNHAVETVATWGMQAGVAQQPWAAWGLARMGLREEAYRPLAAAASWVMSDFHRGVWPEVAHEPRMGYFSPPAALYIQACIEALFGLEVDRPNGRVHVAPCFPSAWPRASISLPGFDVRYTRGDGTMRYELETGEPLARRVEWRLPNDERAVAVRLDGAAVTFDVVTGPGYQELRFDTPATTRSVIEVDFEAADIALDGAASVAQGDSFLLTPRNLDIIAVRDPGGILGTVADEPGGARRLSLRDGLLDGYAGYGRLGLLNFSRRSLLVDAVDGWGRRLLVPYDLAVLPRYEAAAQPIGSDGVLRLVVRNNTGTGLETPAVLATGSLEWEFDLDLPARAEVAVEVRLPASAPVRLRHGDNDARLLLAGPGESLALVVDAAPFFQHEDLAPYAASRVSAVPLPTESLRPIAEWAFFRDHYAWTGTALRVPGLLDGVGDDNVARPADAPGFAFPVDPERRVAVASWKSGNPSVTIPMEGQERVSKISLLLCAFAENHDMYAPIGRISLHHRPAGPVGAAVQFGDAVLARTLYYPGDIDGAYTHGVTGGDFTTAPWGARAARQGLLPLLGVGDGDWAEGQAPAFPQRELWSSSRHVRLDNAIYSVIEIPLPEPTPLDRVVVEGLGVDGAIAVVSVLAERAAGDDSLLPEGVEVPAELLSPRTVFDFQRGGSLDGWQLDDAFSVAPVPGLFSRPTLNTLARGESGTGEAVSPPFTIDRPVMDIIAHGGHSTPGGRLEIHLLDAASGDLLWAGRSPGNHSLQRIPVDVRAHLGREVRLRIVDENTNPGYAWIGVAQVSLGGG